MTNKTVEHNGSGDYKKWSWKNLQKLFKKTGGIRNHTKKRKHASHDIVKICFNFQKSPGDLKELAITQTPGKKPTNYTGVNAR